MHLRTRTRSILLVVPAGLLLATAAACSSSSSPGSGSAAATSSASNAGSSASSSALMVSSNSSLGQIVTTGSGVTVYRYDADTNNPSKSNCTGGCASAWPPVLATGGGMPKVAGVSASAVGEVTRSDGSKQLTLDGWPLYTYAGDSGPGSVSGQGSGGIWWAVTPTGAKAGSAGSGASASSPSAAASPSSSSGGSGGGYGY